MIHNKNLAGWTSLLFILILTACGPAPQAAIQPLNEPLESVALEAVALEATPTIKPTEEPTSPPPSTATALPTATLPATAVPAATATPAATAASLPCPAEPPLKPAYDRYYLPFDSKWPQPDETLPADHFWMSKPLPGGGRLLTNIGFPYGFDDNGRLLLHNGVDSAEALGTPLLAVADGTIVVAQSDAAEQFGWRCNWYGQLVVIELDQTWNDLPVYALYGHVLNITVEPGQRVKRGDQVAEVGFGGAATAPHLHFEVRVGENSFGSTRNPMLWIQPPASRGIIAGRLVGPDGQPWQGVALTLVPKSEEGETLATWSYLGDPDNLTNPDEALAENFVFSDVRPGEYEVYTKIQGIAYTMPVTIYGGDLQTVEIVTQPFVPVTPSAEAPETSPNDANMPDSTPESPESPQNETDSGPASAEIDPQATEPVTNPPENE